MRSCNIDFNSIEQVQVTKKAVNKMLSQIIEDKINKSVTINIIYLDSNGEEISGERITINENYYSLIMSENPDFAPGKLSNEYREDDLWYIIDLIKTEQNQ